MTMKSKNGKKPLGRQGTPFTFYLEQGLATRLKKTAVDRKVPKSVLVRVALDRLLQQLDSGQLDLPLGL
jgi:hypothetical protein